MPDPGSMEQRVEDAYGAAGRAAGEAVNEYAVDREKGRLRPAADAFLLSRIARACVQAAGVPELLAENEKLRDALEWIYAEPEYPEVVQERARAALVPVRPEEDK